MKLPCKQFDAKAHIQFRYAHIKRDGHYLNVCRDKQGVLSCWTSHPHNIAGQLDFLPQWSQLNCLQAGTSLLGELWLHGKRASDVKTAIAQRDTNLSFHCFAIDNWPGFNRFEIERMSLESVQQLLSESQSGIQLIPFIAIEKTKPFEHIANLIKTVAEGKTKDNDIEGIVFKNANLLDWHKWKPRNTIDLLIAGYQPGVGKYLNLVGSIVVRTAEGYEVAQVSGMTDAQRRHISEHSEQYVGKVVEVEYQDVGNNGRLRHPSFLRIRDDKEESGCSVNQDAALAHYWEGSRLFQ
jgi:hypothetical protein